MLENGLTHTSKLIVDRHHTALSVGSGDLNVLSTPTMIALMENAAMLSVAPHLPAGHTTVGAHINVNHLRPTPMGDEIEATAKLVRIEGKKLYFTLTATQNDTIIGSGEHMRVIVNVEKFMPAVEK